MGQSINITIDWSTRQVWVEGRDVSDVFAGVPLRSADIKAYEASEVPCDDGHAHVRHYHEGGICGGVYALPGASSSTSDLIAMAQHEFTTIDAADGTPVGVLLSIDYWRRVLNRFRPAWLAEPQMPPLHSHVYPNDKECQACEEAADLALQDHYSELQTMAKRAEAWHVAKFPDSTLPWHALKLTEEVGELARAIIAEHEGRPGRGDPLQEAGQCLLVLVTLMRRFYSEDVLLAALDELDRHEAAMSPPQS